eukprot:3206366-Heterocapsa_arctica.AAC.1
MDGLRTINSPQGDPTPTLFEVPPTQATRLKGNPDKPCIPQSPGPNDPAGQANCPVFDVDNNKFRINAEGLTEDDSFPPVPDTCQE